MNRLTDTFRLNNGCQIPCIGYGTWKTPDGETAVQAVKDALLSGYRHIDTAAVYGNEASVGEGIRLSGVDREEIFVTSKLWNTEWGYDRTIAAFRKSLEKLGLEYLDLYLIHWPASVQHCADWEEVNRETWRAMIDLYKSGLVRAIGVSNFMPHHLKGLMDMEIAPMVDQIEFHPGYRQDETLKFCRANQIQTEAWSPLGTGSILEDPWLQRMAEKYQKTTAQLSLRWIHQNGVIPLPKSLKPARMVQNASIFDFEISEEDMEEIDHMGPLGFSGKHPDTVVF